MGTSLVSALKTTEFVDGMNPVESTEALTKTPEPDTISQRTKFSPIARLFLKEI